MRFFITKARSLLVLMLLLPLSAQAQSGSDQLRKFLANLVTLEAQFEQKVQSVQDGQVYRSSGMLYLRRPGQFRWDYMAPYPQLIVADGSRIWVHDMELEQVSHRAQNDALDGTPAQLLSESGSIERHFKVKDLESPEGDQMARVELLPRESDSQFSRMVLALSNNQLQTMELTDKFGQVSQFSFSNIKRNPELDDQLFVFNPPPLIDILSD